MKALFADDDEGMRTLVEHILTGNGYEYVCAKDGEEALALLEKEHPDIILLDVMMPKVDGHEVCGRVRSKGFTTPIIMLTAKGDILDKSVGFKMGADDYLVKPFVAQELLLRMEALLRRSQMSVGKGMGSEVLKVDGLEIDTVNRRVTVRGESVVLSPKEYQLLVIMASSPGQVFSHKELTEEMWGPKYAGEITSITVLVHRLRSKIEEDPSNPHFIQTVWHAGYRFGPE
ncbi:MULTISPECIES: response regulator transcription factor [Gordonibacter]|uniref:Response regulator transcription factor n=1 Tax=Gordonibacter faecis TaxID=3047475 RepID=A0ABT7DMY9_9ACTN|nr:MULTISPECIES: response regulator transcription factor [unclassified Gordonibacter]MDJ1649936.1 response regulator transcription factor [Gordonibacter sp. KGMB12511]HIW75867.1 response regulator transcription factor [Candidatus Gordonibacter avicola]